MSSVILCQSVIDALSIWCAGSRNVVATMGHDAFADKHAATLKTKGIEKVFIAYRRDPGGDAAAEAVAEKLIASGISSLKALSVPIPSPARSWELGRSRASSRQPSREALLTNSGGCSAALRRAQSHFADCHSSTTTRTHDLTFAQTRLSAGALRHWRYRSLRGLGDRVQTVGSCSARCFRGTRASLDRSDRLHRRDGSLRSGSRTLVAQ